MNGHGRKEDNEAARLAARISATSKRAAEIVAGIATNDALLHPSLAGRDEELVRIHVEALRFFADHLPGSWVPGYLTNRGMDAVFLDSSPWKIGYAPFSLLCCRVSLTVLSRSARVFVDLHLIDNSSYLPRSWS
jgi:hypothetical protein